MIWFLEGNLPNNDGLQPTSVCLCVTIDFNLSKARCKVENSTAISTKGIQSICHPEPALFHLSSIYLMVPALRIFTLRRPFYLYEQEDATKSKGHHY